MYCVLGLSPDLPVTGWTLLTGRGRSEGAREYDGEEGGSRTGRGGRRHRGDEETGQEGQGHTGNFKH